MLLLSGRLHFQLCQRFFATNASELQRWQRRCDRLTQLQRRIKFKPVESFTVGERTFPLPLATVGPPSSAPTREELEYLKGFFDGDGCVSMSPSRGSIELLVGQNLDSAKVLVRFRDAFGGGIYNHVHGSGTNKAALLWRVAGNTMQHAAEVLGKVPSIKGAQLQIAARGIVAKENRTEVSQRLWLLKQKEHVPLSFDVSWPYFAGFFDAEGSIAIRATCAATTLQISQMNRFVLEHLHTFLHSHGLSSWSLGHGYGDCCYSQLFCADFATSKQTLQRLLDSGLDLKSKQASLALSLTRDNHQAVREDLFNLNGFNRRYQRLDSEGIARAKEIARTRYQLRNASFSNLESLQVKVRKLKEEHLLQNLITRCCRLRRDTRLSLKEGGIIQPTCLQQKIAATFVLKLGRICGQFWQSWNLLF